MKIKIERNSRTGGSILSPINPPQSVDLNDLFEVEVFGTSSLADLLPRIETDTVTVPFAEIQVSWRIVPKVPEARLDDYSFRIIAPPLLKFENIGAEGMVDFLLTHTTDLWIQGAKNGASNAILGSKITVTADPSGCQFFTIPTTIIESEVIKELNNFLSTTDGTLALRKETVPLNARLPNGPFHEIEYEPSSTVDAGGIKFHFPLEIILSNFFDADFDLDMELKFSVTHLPDSVELNVDIDFEFDVSFSGIEHVLGQVVASPHAIGTTIERMLPLIFDCRRPALELQIGTLIFDQTPGLRDALQESQLQAVAIYPGARSLEFTVCTPPPIQPGNERAPRDGVNFPVADG